jgi:succinate-semialdehyde dehydrogenase/glutarate-semialdehyde dehydrogenase
MSLYAVVNPATGETVKEYPTISDDDLRDAISRADQAMRDWSAQTSVEDRAQLVRRVGELHVEQRERLAEIIVREMGKPVEQALAEIDFCGDIYGYYADNAPELLADEPIELLDGEGSAFIRRSPYGVLLGIMPWNFPYYQVARFAGPNLAIGNTILLKHAPQCPESAEAMQEIYEQAGFPAGAYNNIRASNEQIEWVIADPRVRGVSLTGSERAGAAVAEIAGRNLKKIVLELGGSDPFILLSTDDLDAAVENAVAARVDNTGQSCNAAKRFIVVDDLYEPFLEKFTAAITAVEPGDPTKSETEIGPLSSSNATERLAEQLEQALENGAKLVAGGKHDGNFFQTTVLTDITPDNPARHQEFFGPVAQVYRAGDEDEAIALANDTPYGLGSYLMTTDAEQAKRVADRIEAGMVFVNLVGADGAELPFGGVKNSGFGRELGRYGMDEFVNKKLIRIG